MTRTPSLTAPASAPPAPTDRPRSGRAGGQAGRAGGQAGRAGGQAGRAEAPADKRDAIMAAALELFVERGFHGTAVPEVAARAGVGAGTIYRYFASKEALVNTLYQQLKLDLTGRLLRGFVVGGPARETFRGLWARMSEFVDDQPKAFAFLELHHHAAYLDDRSRAMEGRMHDLMTRFIEQAQARGELRRAPPCLLIGVVLGAFTGVVRWAWEYRQPLTADTWALAEQCAWEAVRS
ncbi:MAG: TetR/AcrR family transcriptional regulator [Kofleriaceae bacterium]|nr:TetR/AcrR family transcriptional regulator [Kofleriaceae bacterium]